MDVSLITSALSSLNALKQTVDAAIAIRDFNQTSAKVAEMYSQILDARQRIFDLQTRFSELSAELVSTKDLLKEKEAALADAQEQIAKIIQKHVELDQYERFQYGAAWAYRRKGAAASAEAEPTYCARCFDKGKLGLFQPGIGRDRGSMFCQECGQQVRRV